MTIVEHRILDQMVLEIIEHAQAINTIANELVETAKEVDEADKYVAVANRANKAMTELAMNLMNV